MAILNMNVENYETYIQSDIPVLVEFSAPWCSYCRRLAPVLEATAEKYKDSLIFGMVNSHLCLQTLRINDASSAILGIY